jgi:hypothetical protein
VNTQVNIAPSAHPAAARAAAAQLRHALHTAPMRLQGVEEAAAAPEYEEEDTQ